MYKIYSLSDPISNEIKYIGLTKMSLKDRLRKHIDSSRIAKDGCNRERWVKSLLLEDKKPDIETIEELDTYDFSIEKYWIQQMRSWGFDLTNVTDKEKADMCFKTMKGRIVSRETRLKMSIAFTGRRHTEESKRKMSENSGRRIRQYDLDGNFIKEYRSITEAKKSLGVRSYSISHVLSGRSKTAHKFIWKYLV